MNYNKRCDFDYDKDLFLVKREDAEKLFGMLYDSIHDGTSLTEHKTEYLLPGKYPLRIEHQDTLEAAIDSLGMGRNYVDYFIARRMEEKNETTGSD